VDNDDRKGQAALEVTQVREQGGDVGRGVFVDAMQADEGGIGRTTYSLLCRVPRYLVKCHSASRVADSSQHKNQLQTAEK
jgi:hypothetical protein